MNMTLTLQRTHESGGATFGKLFADGKFLCYTLEDEVRETSQPVGAWKIKGATAIPSTAHPSMEDTPGYRITLDYSARFGPETLTVNDVPGFVGVRMHAGNFAGHEDYLQSVPVDPSKKILLMEEYVEVVD